MQIRKLSLVIPIALAVVAGSTTAEQVRITDGDTKILCDLKKIRVSAGGNNVVKVEPGCLAGLDAGPPADPPAPADPPPSSPDPIECEQKLFKQEWDFRAIGQSDNRSRSEHFKLHAGEAYAFGFMTDGAAKGSVSVSESTGADVPRYVTISTRPCDFSYEPLDKKTFCAQSSNDVTIFLDVGGNSLAKCHLEPNTKYWVNLRNEDAWIARGEDSCLAQTGSRSANCGFVFVLRHN